MAYNNRYNRFNKKPVNYMPKNRSQYPSGGNSYYLNRQQQPQEVDERLREIGIKNQVNRQKKNRARKAIEKAAGKLGPVAELGAKAALNTPKGDKYLDIYADSENDIEGAKNVEKAMRREKMWKRAFAGFFGGIFILMFVVLLVTLYIKNADSQIFSNKNGGTYISEDYIPDDKLVNVFANYPGLYEKIVEKTEKVSKETLIEVDKYLVIATLVSPIANQLIVPVDDHTCGEENCYYFNGESKTWTQFLESWGDQAELLSKMQIMTFTNPESPNKISCPNVLTMEQFADNDMEAKKKSTDWWSSLVAWISGFKDATEAELNAYCTTTPSGKTKVKTIYTQSVVQGEYNVTNNKEHEYVYDKKEDSGGVFYWNLVNKNGFLYGYLKDYLSDDYKDDEEKNYEINKAKIIEIANYIYAYYDSIKKSCEGHKVLESSIKTIKIYNPKSKQEEYGVPEYQEVDFEDQYIGGVMLAEFHSGGQEGLRAFAILARTEAIANVGMDGSGTIENSSNVQNYNPTYTPEAYPDIAEAVEATRGLVVSKFEDPKVWHTEYDSFCPVNTELENGFYYLPDGQQNLPINPEAYEKITHQQFIKPDSRDLMCSCFQNEAKKPTDKYNETKTVYSSSSSVNPNVDNEYPNSSNPKCWSLNGKTHTESDGTVVYGWEYNPKGGHGRGASQYGIKYLDAFGYSQDAIIRYFFPGAQIRVLSSSLGLYKCAYVDYYTGEVKTDEPSKNNASAIYGSGYNSESNYTEVIGGTPLNKPLADALADQGHTIEELNNCIGERVRKAGMGTRAAVVESGVGLLQCTMELTGGYTYPYDHTGGAVGGNKNPDINGKLGVNSKWGVSGGSCPSGVCRYGLNCATFVRWSMCNGGMDLCDKGSTFAHEMYDTTYFPEAEKVRMSLGFQVIKGDKSFSSPEEAFDNIKPGDVLYSNDTTKSGTTHVMLIVGKTDDSITIAENGRKTRVITKNELLYTNTMSYGMLFLDDYYANPANKSGLEW